MTKIREIEELIEVCDSNSRIFISDYKVCEEFKRGRSKLVNSKFCHLRGKKIQKEISREANGAIVKAYGFDELGNVIAIIPNGGFRQYIG